MSRKHRPSPKKNPAPAAKPRREKLLWIWLFLAIAMPLAFIISKKASTSSPSPRGEGQPVQLVAKETPVQITGPVTFAKDIAPIVFTECAHCHHANGSGPFELLTYADVKKRAKDIGRVTAARIMPPWQPEHGYGEFEGERRLAPRQLALIQKWIEQGAPEGNPADLPPAPEFKNQWQLGEPDLVVQPAAYKLPGEGKDVYFNFVTPIPLSVNRYVAAVDLLPGNRVVHHAFINTDGTRLPGR